MNKDEEQRIEEDFFLVMDKLLHMEGRIISFSAEPLGSDVVEQRDSSEDPDSLVSVDGKREPNQERS